MNTLTDRPHSPPDARRDYSDPDGDLDDYYHAIATGDACPRCAQRIQPMRVASGLICPHCKAELKGAK